MVPVWFHQYVRLNMTENQEICILNVKELPLFDYISYQDVKASHLCPTYPQARSQISTLMMRWRIS